MCVRFGRFICRSTISMPGFMQNAPSPMKAQILSSGRASASPDANMVEAHRGIEIKARLAIARGRPPGLAGIARRGHDQLIGATPRQGTKTVEVIHARPYRNRSRVKTTAIGRENVRVWR